MSYSRPSTRSIASQSTKSRIDRAADPARATRSTRPAYRAASLGRRSPPRPAPAPANRASRAHPRGSPRAAGSAPPAAAPRPRAPPSPPPPRRPARRRARPTRSQVHSPLPAPWPARRPCRGLRASNRSTGPNGSPSAESLQPAVARQRPRRLDRRVERLAALLVIAAHVEQPRGKAPPSPARLALGSDDPAPHLDRFLPRQRHRKGRIGGIEQMMAFVEQDPGRRIGPSARAH